MLGPGAGAIGTFMMIYAHEWFDQPVAAWLTSISGRQMG